MPDINDAIEDLVPFAEAILAIKTRSIDLQRIAQNVNARKAELATIYEQQDEAIKKRDQAKVDAATARESEAAAKRGKEEALKQREEILAKATLDGQAAYDEKLTAKQQDLHDIFTKIEVAQSRLHQIEAATTEAQSQLEAIESQISTLKNRFG